MPKALVASNESKGMPMNQQQLRVDPADGKAYTLDSFLQVYGDEEGHRRWLAAGSSSWEASGQGSAQTATPGMVTALPQVLWPLHTFSLADVSFLTVGANTQGGAVHRYAQGANGYAPQVDYVEPHSMHQQAIVIQHPAALYGQVFPALICFCLRSYNAVYLPGIK